MKSTAIACTIFALAGVYLPNQSEAAVLNNIIVGSQSASENGCTFFAVQFLGWDCSYNASDPSGFGSKGWVGPEFDGAYYTPGTSPGPVTEPSPGDGKASLSISGKFSINDNGSASGNDDLLSGIWTISAGTRLAFSGPSRYAEESWTSITHTLSPVLADAVAVNGSGGFDYVIGSLGFPAPLTPDGFINTTAFPSDIGSDLFTGTSAWAGSGAISVARVEGNPGAATNATATGYSCTDTNGTDCASSPGLLGSTGGSFGYENFLLALSTDSVGNILTAEAFFTHEFLLPDSPSLPETWRAGTLSFTGSAVPVPPAMWLLGSALAVLGWIRRRKLH